MWLSLLGYAQTPNLVIRHLSDITEIGQTTINDIYQDENGCMWFASREGVIRYNGNTSEHIVPLLDNPNSLFSPIITSICGDKHGHVFFANDQVHCYDLRTRQMHCCWSHQMQTIAASDSVLYIAIAPYVIAYHIYNATTDTIASLPIDKNDRINHLDYHTNKLYVCTSTGSIFLIDLNSREYMSVCHVGSCVSFAREDKDGVLWIGTWEDGLFTLHHGQLSEMHVPRDFVRDIAFSSDASVWVGTHQGLYRSSDGQTWTPINGLTNESVWRVYADLEGTLWIGSYFGGIDYFNPVSNVYHYWSLPSIKGNTPVVNSIIPVSAQQYYLCTEGNGLLLYDIQKNTMKQYLSSRASNIKSSYFDAEHHRLYLGLHLNGLCSFDTQTKSYQYYRLPYSLFYQNQVIRAIVPYGDDLLCGTYNGVYRFSRSTELFTSFSDTLNHQHSYVCDLCFDNADHLWVIGEGIVQYTLSTQHVCIYQSTLARAAEYACVVDDKMYIGTVGYGVWETNVDQMNLQPVVAIKNKFVHNMLSLPNGNLLIVFTDGIVLYNTHNQSAQTYTYANGLPLHSLYNGACTVLSDSSIMLAGMDGIAVFRPSLLQTSSSAPHIVFDRICVNDIFQPVDSSIHLMANSTLSLDVTTNHYFNRPYLRYTLSSWNNQWVDLTPQTSTIRLMGLRTGKHILRVEALSADNNKLLATREFTIYQRPPFYLSILALIIYFLLLAVFVYIVAQRMKRHYQRKAEWEWQQKMLQSGDAMSKVYAYINDNLGNEQLNIEMLVSHVGVSRTKLFTIVKNSTGLTPNDLILRTRLKKAAELLSDPKIALTISEIGYDVGFSSPKYFTKCFKSFYHQTPTEYRLSKIKANIH